MYRYQVKKVATMPSSRLFSFVFVSPTLLLPTDITEQLVISFRTFFHVHIFTFALAYLHLCAAVVQKWQLCMLPIYAMAMDSIAKPFCFTVFRLSPLSLLLLLVPTFAWCNLFRWTSVMKLLVNCCKRISRLHQTRCVGGWGYTYYTYLFYIFQVSKGFSHYSFMLPCLALLLQTATERRLRLEGVEQVCTL